MTADKDGTVDKDSMVPLYEQLMQLITARIDAGEFPAGKRLPSEPDLSEYYGISRDTVRKAMRALQEKHWVAIVRGKGMFSLGHGEELLSYRSRVRKEKAPRPL
jgi:GntR family transcriptional regulator